MHSGQPCYPRRFPLYTIAGIIMSLAALVWFFRLWQKHAPFVQSHDIWTYARVTGPAVPFWKSYRILMNGRDFAIPSDQGTFYFESRIVPHGWLRQFLREQVYSDQPIWRVLLWPLGGFGVVLIALVGAGTYLDRKQGKDRLIRGPELVSRWKWNGDIPRRNRGPFIQTSRGGRIYLPKDTMSGHIVIRGATRTGKSSLVRQLAYQLLRDGPIVFWDVKREFVEEFAGPDDWHLDPSDLRCPRLKLADFAPDEMRATAAGTAAFPEEPRDQPFFKKHPRFLTARILTDRQPATEEFARILTGHKEIDLILKGTLLANSISPSGGEMRAGMLAHLAELGRSLSFWPTEKETERVFSLNEWLTHRKGNIFLTSSPDTIDALRPSMTMLLDLIILGMQKTRGPGSLILDEIAQAGHVPKLETAMSLQGAAGNPIILAFQEITQMKQHYGELYRSITSQAYTQIVFRTAEQESAKHAAGILGEHEIERLRESRSFGNLFFHRPHRSMQTERPTVPVVLPGEIQSLKNLHSYIAQAGRVLKFRLKYTPPVIRAPRSLERIIKTPAPIPEAPAPYKKRYGQATLPIP